MKYYCYRHIRLDKNEVFYVGIAKVKNSGSERIKYYRAFDFKVRSKWWKSIVRLTQITVEIFYECDSLEEIFAKEKEFIKLYGRKDLGLGTLCNMTDGGEGGFGIIFTQERKERMSEIMKNKPHKPLTEEHKINIGKGSKGRKAWNKGIKMELSDEQRKKRSELSSGENNGMFGKPGAWRDKKQHPNTIKALKKKNSRLVLQFDLGGNFIQEWPSVTDASKAMGTWKVKKCLRGLTTCECGFIWKYKPECND